MSNAISLEKSIDGVNSFIHVFIQIISYGYFYRLVLKISSQISTLRDLIGCMCNQILYSQHIQIKSINK